MPIALQFVADTKHSAAPPPLPRKPSPLKPDPGGEHGAASATCSYHVPCTPALSATKPVDRSYLRWSPATFLRLPSPPSAFTPPSTLRCAHAPCAPDRANARALRACGGLHTMSTGRLCPSLRPISRTHQTAHGPHERPRPHTGAHAFTHVRRRWCTYNTTHGLSLSTHVREVAYMRVRACAACVRMCVCSDARAFATLPLVRR